MQQHRKARRALDQGADRRAAKAQDEVSFPVPWHCPSAASAGRWLIMISGETKPLPRRRVRALGTRTPARFASKRLVPGATRFGLG